MSQLQQVAEQRATMDTIADLTGAFEGIASMRISQTKNQVLQSQRFFSELWHIYSQLRVDKLFHYGRAQAEGSVNKQLYIIITSEGGFSGDIDQKVIDAMLKKFHPDRQDIVVVGHHGAVRLIQQGIAFNKYFTLPSKERNINVLPLIKEARLYNDTVVFYQSYRSLLVQEVKEIDLSSAVQEEGKTMKAGDSFISEANYIFEPSTFEVVAHLERSMMQIALSQFILDSKLAQYASRFKAMNAAKERATDLQHDLLFLYNRTKRRISDERLKEMVNGLNRVELA